jgi:Uma2 family endonuclease
MVEYLENGALLGWLIDPMNRRVYIYRPGQAVEDLDSPATVSGSPVLPGFVFNVQEIW